MSNRRNFLKLLGLAPVAVATVAEAKAVEFTVGDAVRQFEAGRVVKDGLPTAYCQTGNSYITIGHNGIRPEGASEEIKFSTREEAIRGWLASVTKYAEGRTGTLYWRWKPELSLRETLNGREDWMVYSRLVITDNPEIYETVYDNVAGKWPFRKDV